MLFYFKGKCAQENSTNDAKDFKTIKKALQVFKFEDDTMNVSILTLFIFE